MEYPKAALSVDIVCLKLGGPRDQPQVLLVKRKNDPYKNMWALPGGFVDIATGERTEQAANRELYEETNIRAGIDTLNLFGVYSTPDRDPRQRTITIAYWTVVEENDFIVRAGDDAAEAAFFPVSLPAIRRSIGLAFDHGQILDDCAQERLYMNCNGVWQMDSSKL